MTKLSLVLNSAVLVGYAAAVPHGMSESSPCNSEPIPIPEISQVQAEGTSSCSCGCDDFFILTMRLPDFIGSEEEEAEASVFPFSVDDFPSFIDEESCIDKSEPEPSNVPAELLNAFDRIPEKFMPALSEDDSFDICMITCRDVSDCTLCLTFLPEATHLVGIASANEDESVASVDVLEVMVEGLSCYRGCQVAYGGVEVFRGCMDECQDLIAVTVNEDEDCDGEVDGDAVDLDLLPETESDSDTDIEDSDCEDTDSETEETDSETDDSDSEAEDSDSEAEDSDSEPEDSDSECGTDTETEPIDSSDDKELNYEPEVADDDDPDLNDLILLTESVINASSSTAQGSFWTVTAMAVAVAGALML